MSSIKENLGLKCPNHDYVRYNYHFTYQSAYPSARPLSSIHSIMYCYTIS